MAIYSLFGKNGGMERIDVHENDWRNSLEIGRILYFNGYGDHSYVIVKRSEINQEWAFYGVTYDCVSLGNYSEYRTQAIGLKRLSEKTDNRIAVYITDEYKTADEVLEYIEKAKQAKEYAKRAKAEKDEHKTVVMASLPSKYPYLTPIKDSGKADRVMGAKNIRIELKRAFPDVKFSVKSDSYSGGNSIDIYWTDGPATEQVTKITNKYEQGSFDGMTDCYNYEENLFSDVFGGSKYVMEQRRCSDEAYNKTAIELGYKEAIFNPKTGQFDGVDYGINETIKRETWKRAF